METVPNVSLEDHLLNLVSHLRKYFPELSVDTLAFYDMNACYCINNLWSIKQDDIMSLDGLESLFEKLCLEGRHWINLSGDSWFENTFLVSVEYSARSGSNKTLIALGGPVLNGDGSPLLQTYLKVLRTS